jgi:hypothetical protein
MMQLQAGGGVGAGGGAAAGGGGNALGGGGGGGGAGDALDQLGMAYCQAGRCSERVSRVYAAGKPQ